MHWYGNLAQHSTSTIAIGAGYAHPVVGYSECMGEPINHQIAIFDLDGTVSDDRHRAHHVEDSDPPDWDSYYAGIVDDAPVPGAVALYNILVNAGIAVHVLTGRKEMYREPTTSWLQVHKFRIHPTRIHMRADDDRRRNPVFKRQVIEELLAEGYDIQLVIDDHPGVAEAVSDLCPVLTVRGFRGEGENEPTRSTW